MQSPDSRGAAPAALSILGFVFAGNNNQSLQTCIGDDYA
jgi:hypothetical protein